jgi:aurora kinase, other
MMMAARTMEARFERMSVNDENDPGDGSKTYQKAKVNLT